MTARDREPPHCPTRDCAGTSEVDSLRHELDIVIKWARAQAVAQGEATVTIDTLRAELERERMRLAACGVVAMSNTAETATKNRDIHADYRSASFDQTAQAVDREMALRARVAELEAAGRAVLKCNDQVCAFDHVGCSTQCRADEMMHAALRDVPSAGGGQS